MTGKDRALAALRHEEPDRVPIDYWATRETDAHLCKAMGLADRQAILDNFGVDFCYIAGPTYIGPPLRRIDEHTDVDIWGVPRRMNVVGTGPKAQSYENVLSHPLADARTVADILDYPLWPSPDWFDYSVIADQCRACGDRCVMFMGDRLNRIAQLKPAMYIRGIEQILVDMMAEPDIFQAIVGRIAAFYDEYLQRILQAAAGGIDVVVTGDDFGAQESLLCKPSLWREMIQPNFRRFIDISHSSHVPVMHHTCGSVWTILPDLVESGLDILNPIQPDARDMGARRLKAAFGDRLTFHGGISIQKNLPFGTPDDVRREVRDLMAAMKPGGGFWACTAHNIQADVPPENILALYDAYREFGQYR
jgi:uroporphyrinogen decarboxylase